MIIKKTLVLVMYGRDVIRTLPLTEAEIEKRIKNWKSVYGNKVETRIIEA